MEAGRAAGLSGPSILGVMVHPIYGPWIAFRAAILVDELIDALGEAHGFDPCPSCTARTCIAACPANALSFANGWDIPKCLTHRVEVEADCAARCHARAGCVLGPEHRYPDDELAYHQMRSLRAMRPYYEANIKPGRS
jgi:epoxyqueuosine reductase QueG